MQHLSRYRLIGLVLALIVALPLSLHYAFAADADLQQYNGSAVWSADLTTASTLLPRDGKRITADSNAVGSAPVNRSLKQIKDLLIGIHQGIFGIGTATRRTVKSLEADGTGGNVSTLLAGGIASTSPTDRSLMTPTDVAVFGRTAGGGETKMTKGAIVFTNTVDGAGNPARTTPVNNQVRPINIAKAWINAITDGAGAVTIADGYNLTSCAVIDNNTVNCTLALTLDSVNAVAVASTDLGHDIDCKMLSTSVLQCDFFDRGAMSQNCLTGGGPNRCDLRVVVFGRQTS